MVRYTMEDVDYQGQNSDIIQNSGGNFSREGEA